VTFRETFAVLLGGNNDFELSTMLQHRLREPRIRAIRDARDPYQFSRTEFANSRFKKPANLPLNVSTQTSMPGDPDTHGRSPSTDRPDRRREGVGP
jgi:hypothetical protein